MARLLTGEGKAPEAYGDRLRMLLDHHIALWDSIDCCERQGSLDSDIRKEQGNDFTALLREYPSIRIICFNGTKSYQCFKKYNAELLERTDIAFHPMPSTSPANAKWTMERLLEEWGKILCFPLGKSSELGYN